MMTFYPLMLFACSQLTGGSDSTVDRSDLIAKALEVRQMAHAPYSKYLVGAAILTKSGKVYTGCNVENASYGLTICAERTAVFKAVSEGDKEFAMIVVATRNGGMPCGACRQVLNEFSPEVPIICIDEHGHVHGEHTLNALLPGAFGPANLE